MNDSEIKKVVITHANGTTSERFHYRLGAFTSSVYSTESACKAQLTRHIKRGGVSAEWIKRHPGRVYAHAVRKMVAAR